MTTFMKTRGGKPAVNQLIHTTASGVYLQSYDSMVAYYPHKKYPHESSGEALLGDNWDYSPTTRRYVRAFLAEIGASPNGKPVVSLWEKWREDRPRA